MDVFPMMLVTARMHALVVGGGPVAAAKLETLAGCGATVTLVAQRVGEGVRRLAATYDGSVVIHERAYRHADLAGMTVVIVAVDDAALARRIGDEARAAGLPVNVVDNPELCDFIFPALIRRGRIRVAISSGGDSPVLARLLKQRVEDALPDGTEALADFLAAQTPAVRERLPEVQARRLFWERIIRGPVGEAVAAGDREAADRLLAAALVTASGAPQAALSVITMPPGDPDGMTIRASRLLSRADLVIALRMAGIETALDRYARRDAEKVIAGERDAAGDVAWTAACRRLTAALEAGDLVVCLLPAGDPATPGWTAEAAALARRAGCPLQPAAS